MSFKKKENGSMFGSSILKKPPVPELVAENTDAVESRLSARAQRELHLLVQASRAKNVKFVMIQTLLLVEAITSADGVNALNVQILAGAIIFVMIVYVGYMLIVEKTGDATLTGLPKMDMVFTNLLTGLTAIKFFGYNQNIDIGLIFLAIALFMDDLFSTSEGIEAVVTRAAITNTDKNTIKVAKEDNLYTEDENLKNNKTIFSALVTRGGATSNGNDNDELDVVSSQLQSVLQQEGKLDAANLTRNTDSRIGDMWIVAKARIKAWFWSFMRFPLWCIQVLGVTIMTVSSVIEFVNFPLSFPIRWFLQRYWFNEKFIINMLSHDPQLAAQKDDMVPIVKKNLALWATVWVTDAQFFAMVYACYHFSKVCVLYA